MPDALIIRLAATAGSPDAASQPAAQWLLVDAAGARLGVVLSGELPEAAQLAVGRKVIVLVPGAEVHLAQPMLPAKRGAQLDQVIRYALEDQLATDVDALHFAKGKRASNGATPVAAVEIKSMRAWLEALASAGITPDALYSEADVLPASSGLALVVDRGWVYVRRGDTRAALDVQPIDEALQLALGGADDLPTDAIVYVAQTDYEANPVAFEALRERALQVKLLPEGALPLFALGAIQDSAVNLLSGPYARKKTWNAQLAPWRIAAVLALVALGLHVTVSALQFWQLARAERQLDQRIRDVVTQTLPGVQVRDTRRARQQFEAQLGAVNATGGTGLLGGLDALATTLEQVPDTRIEALAYRSKTIDLRITAPNVDALARVQQLVGEQGFQAEIQSATPQNNKVEGRLQLKLPGA